jgi:phenylacetate-CoA ligase
MDIIDAHAHLNEKTAPLLRTRMEELGIGHTVVVAGGTIDPWALAKNVASGGRSQVLVDNSVVLAESKKDGRIIPFYFVTPSVPVTAELERELRAFAGLKLAPAVHGIDFRDRRVRQYIELACTLGLPVYSHCLFDERSSVERYCELAAQFREVRFILGHAGRHYFDLPAVETIQHVENVWFETSGGFELVVREAVRRLGAARVVFGSEFPIQGQASELVKVRSSVSDGALEKVLGGNMRALLGERWFGGQPSSHRTGAGATEAGLASPPWLSFARAFERSPYYRAKCEALGVSVERRTADDAWQRLPFLTKEDLRAAYPFGLLSVPMSEVAMVHESSGTSGQPTPTYLTARDLDDAFARILSNAVALHRDDVVLVKTPYSMLSTAHQMHGAARACGATVIPADNRSELMPYARAARLIADYRPTILYCMPIELIYFARTAIRMGKDPRRDFPWIRACLVNGEILSPGKRRYLEHLWGTRIFEDYGSTETHSLAGQCSAGALHLWEDQLYVELLADEGAPTTREGTGELVVTAFRREAMPLMRYRTGDWVRIERGPCPCGSTRARVVVACRQSDRILCQGRSVEPKELEDVVYGPLVGLGPVFWAAEYDQHGCRVQLEPLASERQLLAERMPLLSRRAHARLGLALTVELVDEGTLARQDLGSEERAMHKPRYVARRGEATHGLNYVAQRKG